MRSPCDDAFPMSLPQELILRVGRAAYISLVDLRRGYWQVPLALESQSHTPLSRTMANTLGGSCLSG